MSENEKATGEEVEIQESPVEEFALSDLEKILANPDICYFCVDTLWSERPRRKLIDPRSVLTRTIIQNLYEWGVSPNQIIRVTKNPDDVDKYLETSEKDIAHYAHRMHHYLVKIFTEEKTSYKHELQGLTRTAVEMLDKPFSYINIPEVTVGPNDLRSFSSYYDHLVNTAVYWLAAFSAYNRARKDHPGAIESWKMKNKPEVSKLTAGNAGRSEFSVYYDIYDRDASTADMEKNKKSDLSLVISGFYSALFHDISLLREPAILIAKKDALDEKMKSHPDDSNTVIKEKLAILADERPLTKNIIKNHHEYIDGSGYPGKKTEKNIHVFGQLLTIVDMYDEYSTIYRRGTILRHLGRGAGRILSGDLLRAFLSVLRPFEVGEQVDVYLEKNPKPVMRGQVMESPNRFRPIVKITEALSADHSDKSGKPLDLSTTENTEYGI